VSDVLEPPALLAAKPAPASIDLPVPKVALAIGAHPDDIEFGCGGTFAKWARQGCEIHHAVLTDGSKGSWDPEIDGKELVPIRQEEQRAAAKILGGSGEVIFFGLVDGELENSEPVRHDVVRLVRRLKPDVVLGHDPWRRYRLHPDHRHAGFVLTDAIAAARDPLFYRGLLVAHRPAALLLWEADEPNHFEDIGESFEVKIEALLTHHSQLRSTMQIGDDVDLYEEQVEAFRARVRHSAGENGERAGLALAEAFRHLTP
jgi:LmbE family N-acetylglucosaminyl deacetylase